MRVAFWDWGKADKVVMKNGRARTKKAADALAAAVRSKCPVGTMSHPMYKKGKFAGQPWTKRDGGSLKRSVRVVEKDEKSGYELASISLNGPRIYVGNYFSYYAAIVEFYTPFVRPTADRMKGQIKSILENG